MISKYSKYDKEIISLFKKGVKPYTIATLISKKEGYTSAVGAARDRVNKIIYGNNQVSNQLEERGINGTAWDIAWIKTKEGSYRIKKEYIDFERNKSEFLESIKEISPITKLKSYKNNSSKIAVIDLADPHFGKLSLKEETGDSYNLEIAKVGLEYGVTKLLSKIVSYGGVEKIIFVIGNDALHIDNNLASTTRGTKQDVSSIWWDIFKVAFNSYVEILQSASHIAPVYVVFCPSNHDYHLGFGLAHSLEAYFHNDPNIEFDVELQHRKYLLYGVNLLGFSHGDYIKPHQVPDLMKTEAKKAWASAKFGYFYLHHLHHKDRTSVKGTKKLFLEKDYSDVTVIAGNTSISQEDRVKVEYIRSISAADSWHARAGYVGNIRAIEAFIHDLHYGQTDRLTEIFNEDDIK